MILTFSEGPHYSPIFTFNANYSLLNPNLLSSVSGWLLRLAQSLVADPVAPAVPRVGCAVAGRCPGNGVGASSSSIIRRALLSHSRHFLAVWHTRSWSGAARAHVGVEGYVLIVSEVRCARCWRNILGIMLCTRTEGALCPATQLPCFYFIFFIWLETPSYKNGKYQVRDERYKWVKLQYKADDH